MVIKLDLGDTLPLVRKLGAENSGGHLLCTDFTTGKRFLVNGHHYFQHRVF